MRVVLASGSKRRQLLLGRAEIKFEAKKADVDERGIIAHSPAALVKKRALAKATHISADNPDSVVIGADTVVVASGKILGKPKTRNEALEFLGRITGRKADVLTGVAVVCESRDYAAVWAERASVKFREISEKAALAYAKSGKWRGKAGGFNIAEPPVRNWVEKISGERETIIGLPMKRLKEVMAKLQVENE